MSRATKLDIYICTFILKYQEIELVPINSWQVMQIQLDQDYLWIEYDKFVLQGLLIVLLTDT